MSTSPTSLTLARLRKVGWTAAVVEKWKPVMRNGKLEPYGVRVDLFGVIDIIAIYHGFTLGVQATSAANHAARVKKAAASPLLAKWLEGESRDFEVWSWKKPKHRWVLRTEGVAAAGGGGK